MSEIIALQKKVREEVSEIIALQKKVREEVSEIIALQKIEKKRGLHCRRSLEKR